ncbi:hypothetical protein ACJIZ3_004263 [Penstemon smallii]|uniref:Pentatricopeptide repeat-containing protein n=1 Tax=Penstemon smallii TaxID=265156 RepID=A0ABD3S1L2_9LAMI
MFSCKIQTKFRKSISHSPTSFAIFLLQSSSIISSPLHQNSPNNLYSSWIPQVIPIKTYPIFPRTFTRKNTGHFSNAYQLFDKLSHRKIRISEYNLLRDAFNIVQSVNLEPNIKSAKKVHALALKYGALADLPTATSLLTVYSRTKDFVSSVALFDEVLDKDLVFWNAMMTACIENKYFETALVFFKKIVLEGIEFDPITLVIVISALSNLKNVKQGRVIHGLSIKAGVLSDTVLSNALIDIYAKCGDLSSSECMFAGVECKDIITWNSIIIGCFYNSHPEKCLMYFRRMISSEIEVDKVNISCAIAACTSLQEFDVGKAIHRIVIKSGYEDSSHISVANSLISFYSQIRDINTAVSVFKGMEVKNVISWNAMIKGLFLNGEIAKAFSFLRDMQFGSIQPDMATVVTVVPFCAELMLLREGKATHCFAIRREMASELSVINSLINMYSKCDNVNKAEYLFLNMPKKDLVAWNTMISGYALNGRSYESQTSFKKMMGSSSKCTLVTLLAIIHSCDSPNSLEFGRSIHGWHIKLGFSNQIFAINSLIHMYISCESLMDAVKLFGTIKTRADITSWNTIISGCTQKGNFREALEYFDSMWKASQIHWNSITLVNVLSSCGNLGLVLEGKLVHGLALKTRAGADIRVQNSLISMYGRLEDSVSAKLAFDLSKDHNLCSWNCVISALSQNEDAKKALELFRSLEFDPNEITISTILSACTQLGAINYGKQIHGHVFRFNLHRNPFISAALVDMYSNSGRLDVAEKVFITTPEKSVSAWNSLISAYGFHNFGSKAIETFQEMIKFPIRPTNSTFTSLLSACSHSGLVEEGRFYYDQMLSKFKVQCTVEHHVCMVDILGRAGRLDEAYDLIKKLPTEPEPGVWGALLSACSYHGDLEMGREVADILFSLEPQNVSYYVCLCNMYVGAGRWEEAVELRNIIEGKQLKKPAGYSLIDVGLR